MYVLGIESRTVNTPGLANVALRLEQRQQEIKQMTNPGATDAPLGPHILSSYHIVDARQQPPVREMLEFPGVLAPSCHLPGTMHDAQPLPALDLLLTPPSAAPPG
jgi:hypothetical protein